MVIVVEGPDGSGKTTLVRALAEEFRSKHGDKKSVFPVSLPTPLVKRQLFYAQDPMEQALADIAVACDCWQQAHLALHRGVTGHLTVFDRWCPISHPIYLQTRYSRFSPVAASIYAPNMDPVLDHIPHPDLYVFLDIDPGRLMARIKEREERKAREVEDRQNGQEVVKPWSKTEAELQSIATAYRTMERELRHGSETARFDTGTWSAESIVESLEAEGWLD